MPNVPSMCFPANLVSSVLSMLLCCVSGAIGGGESYGDREDNAVVTYITCDGTESSLLNCSFNSSDFGIDCGQLKDAHVVCQGM